MVFPWFSYGFYRHAAVGLGICQPFAEETRPRYCLRGRARTGKDRKPDTNGGFMGFYRDFMEFYGISLDFLGILWNFLGFYGIYPLVMSKCTIENGDL